MSLNNRINPQDQTQRTFENDANARRMIPVDGDGNVNSVQYPSSADGDSIYAKDVWVEESDSTGWTGEVTDPFDDLHSQLSYTGTDSPKVLFIHFRRTVYSHAIGFGSTGGGAFHNLRIEYIGSGNITRYTDDSIYADATPRTSYLAESPPLAYNAIRLTFNTTDDITITNITIRKSITVDAKLSATKPDGTVTDIDATAGGNLKVSLEEVETAVAKYFNPFDSMSINDIDESGLPVAYYGFEDEFGNWCIMKEDATTSTNPTYRYATGTSGYSTAWTNRASQSYDIFGSKF